MKCTKIDLHHGAPILIKINKTENFNSWRTDCSTHIPVLNNQKKRLKKA